jgi:hypothetical protein
MKKKLWSAENPQNQQGGPFSPKMGKIKSRTKNRKTGRTNF